VSIVTFAADSPNSRRASYITSDNLAEAKYAAEEIAGLMGGSGEYAVLENPGQSNHDLRVTAFIAYMEEHFPDMKLVGRQASNQDANRAYQAVQAMLQANPNLGALWIPEAGSAEGAVAAVLEANADVIIMHADVTPTTLEHIKAGNIHKALNPNQGIQGYMGFITTFMAAHPDLIDPFNDYKVSGYNPAGVPFIDNGFAVITKDNTDSFDLNVYMEGR
jgi:ribose transport system substrate-binding protein